MKLNIKLIDENKQEELLKKGYIKTWMLFEVQSSKKEVTENAMKKHIESLNKESCFFIECNTSDINEVEAHDLFKQKGINVLYSQVSEVTMLTKDLDELTTIVINYGPSAIEILEPEKMTITMREAQNVLSSIADMMHKFMRAGIGGMIIK